MHYHVLFAVGFVLLIVVTLFSLVADYARVRIRRKFGGY
jgi:ABC-type phosphate transport system permease subunit